MFSFVNISQIIGQEGWVFAPVGDCKRPCVKQDIKPCLTQHRFRSVLSWIHSECRQRVITTALKLCKYQNKLMYNHDTYTPWNYHENFSKLTQI